MALPTTLPVPVDELAVGRLKEMALAGDFEAETELGTRYFKGEGLAVDYVEGVKLYEQAASRGFPLAELDLGIAYGSGLGVPRDDRRAAKLITDAAATGLPRASSPWF